MVKIKGQLTKGRQLLAWNRAGWVERRAERFYRKENNWDKWIEVENTNVGLEQNLKRGRMGGEDELREKQSKWRT